MSTYRLFLLPIYYLLPTKWQWRPSGQLGNSYKSLSVLPTTLATYFLYIVSLISIDLELSRSFNSSHCKAYSYKPGSHCLLSNYLNRTTCCTINLLPHLRSHYFYYLCKCFEPLPGTSLVLVITFKYQTNERSTLTDDRTRPTNELTNQKRQNKVLPRRQLDPA